MQKNEIKKFLYKNKPLASFVKIQSGIAYYIAVAGNDQPIQFEIPVDDMGDAKFLYLMDAKLLIRWLV